MKSKIIPFKQKSFFPLNKYFKEQKWDIEINKSNIFHNLGINIPKEYQSISFLIKHGSKHVV